MENPKVQIWKGGLPYGPQVQRLRDSFPNPEEEKLFSHNEFEALLGEVRGSQRYYGIINSWRKYLINTLGIDSDWNPGEGLLILPPAKRLECGERDTKRGIRRVKRGIRRTAATPRDRLDEIGKARYDHAAMAYAKMIPALDEGRKALAVDIAPVKSLPKPKLVQDKKAG